MECIAGAEVVHETKKARGDDQPPAKSNAKETKRPAECFVQACLKVAACQQFLCNSDKQKAVKDLADDGARSQCD